MPLNYNDQIKVGDVIESIMDLKAGTTEFKINGLSVGKVEINKKQKYVAAIMIYSEGDELELM